MPAEFDLHCHSRASDGTLSPTELVHRAHARGVRVLALSDHDTTAGVAEARQAAAPLGMTLVPAIELSTRYQDRSMHVVGLGVTPGAPELAALIGRLDLMREQRARTIGERLAKAGVDGAYEGAVALADGALPTRTHFARYLVQQGKAATVGDVFKRYLSHNKPGYVSAEWPELDETLAAIRAAGGVAVLAHPHSYGWTGAWTRRILQAFVAEGGEALEVACGNSSPNHVQTAAGNARRFNLMASQGSDFHGPEQPWIELGRMPPLPADLTPVWQAPALARWLAPAASA